MPGQLHLASTLGTRVWDRLCVAEWMTADECGTDSLPSINFLFGHLIHAVSRLRRTWAMREGSRSTDAQSPITATLLDMDFLKMSWVCCFFSFLFWSELILELLTEHRPRRTVWIQCCSGITIKPSSSENYKLPAVLLSRIRFLPLLCLQKRSGVISADNDKNSKNIDIPYFLNHLKSQNNRVFFNFHETCPEDY